jgi:ABC-2 type transport system permease protein
MNKFWYLTKYGLKKKFKSKGFIISNIVIFVLLLLVFNIDSIITFFGGTFNEKTKIYVVDNSNEFYDSFKDNFYRLQKNIDEDDEKIEMVKSDKTKEELEDEIKNSIDIVVEFEKSEENVLQAKIITENYIDVITYQSIIEGINNTKYQISLKESNIDEEELMKIYNPVKIDRVILDESKNTEEENMNLLMSVVFPTIILPFCMLIILLVQLIGGEINEEKSTRGMEIIISNVPVKHHFYSKLLSNNLFIIIQSILLFLYGAIGLFLRSLFGTNINSDLSDTISTTIDSFKSSGVLDKMIYILPLTIILLILSFLAYSLIAGIVASITTSQEDYQHMQTPIMIICMTSYFLAIMSGMFNGSILIKFLSYVPLISFLLSPALLLIGQIGIIDIVISIIVMIVFNMFIGKYGLKIYKVGILNYSTDKLWKKIFKATKE